MGTQLLKLIHHFHLAGLCKSAREFSAACKNPQSAQESILKATLSSNASSSYGRGFHFSGIRSVSSFQRQVSIVSYEDIKPWINKAESGEKGTLTSEVIKFFELTSGSSRINKLIPYTASLSRQFSNAIDPWIFNTYRNHPNLKGALAYFSLSPAVRVMQETSGGIPVGVTDDTEYFTPVSRWAIKQMMAVPSDLSQASNIDQWKYKTSVHLLCARNLGLISVWSPTFLTPILEYIEDHWDELLHSVASKSSARGEELKSLGSPTESRRVWPKLSVISCWTDGVSAHYLNHLQRRFPGVFIQSKGLMATECVVSIPYYELASVVGRNQSCGSILAVNSHFLEFEDLNGGDRKILLAHQLKKGGIYSPIVTTAGGLYRYQLKDVIECLDYQGNTPRIQFIAKQDRISDICGEKIHPAEVENALRQCSEQLGFQYNFALLAPNKEARPFYTLYIEPVKRSQSSDAFVYMLDRLLQNNQHYYNCRQLGQLAPIRAVSVENGYKHYVDTLVEQGIRYGDIKPTVLESRFDWSGVFGDADSNDSKFSDGALNSSNVGMIR